MARIYKSFSTTSPDASQNGNLYDIDVVVENVKNLFKTKKGEYPMNPDLGSIAHDFIHQPSLTEGEKGAIIEDSLVLLENEPRLNNISVDVEELSNGYYVIVNANLIPQNQEVNLSINMNEED
jgi:phage baseplate assembly protein W